MAVSTGSFTGSYFGIPGSVFLRGDIGDNFFRGFRRVENRGNFQTPVAATDHIEVVKGPPSPIYGGGRVGGFLNFIPKSTRSESAKWLEHATGKVSITYGSYDEKRGSTDAHTSLAAIEEDNFFGKTSSSEPNTERATHPFIKTDTATIIRKVFNRPM